MPCARWSFGLVCLVVLNIVHSACLAQAPVEVLRPDAAPKATGKASLTYDGKPFEFWHRQFDTELKPVLRLKAFDAIVVFGSNGYADEVTRSLLKVIDSFDEDDLERLGPHVERIMEQQSGNAETHAEVDVSAALEQAVAIGVAQVALQKSGGVPLDLSKLQPQQPERDRTFDEAQLYVSLAAHVIKIGKRCSVPVLVGMLEDETLIGMGRASAVSLIGEQGPKANAAVPALLKIAGNAEESEITREAAVTSLAALQAPVDQIVAALRPLSTSQSSAVRAHLVTALAKVGDGPNAATPILTAALDDKDVQVALNAAKSLMQQNQFPREHASKLLAILASRDQSLRNEAEQALDELGVFRAYRHNELKQFQLDATSLENARYLPAFADLLQTAANNSQAPTETTLAVMEIVGKIGSEARDSAKVLKRIADGEDQNPAVRAAAQELSAKLLQPTAK